MEYAPRLKKTPCPRRQDARISPEEVDAERDYGKGEELTEQVEPEIGQKKRQDKENHADQKRNVPRPARGDRKERFFLSAIACPLVQRPSFQREKA